MKRYDMRGVGSVGPQIQGSPCGTTPPTVQPEDASCKRFRQYPLGFGQDDVPSGETVNVTVEPQIPFKADRVMIPSNIGDSFDVLDIKVGKDSQLPASDQPIDGIAFSEVSMGACVDMDTAQPNTKITLQVRNKSANTVSFRAVLYGTAID